MLCNHLQNVVATTYIFRLQLSTFIFYNKQAIQQIKEKQYDLKLRGRLGEDKENKILAVGISYDKKSKNHKCRVETL